MSTKRSARQWGAGLCAATVLVAACWGTPPPAVPSASFNEWLAETFPEWVPAFPPVDFEWIGADHRPAPGDAMLFRDISSRQRLFLSADIYWMLYDIACGGEREKPCGYEHAEDVFEDASLSYESAYFGSLETGSAAPMSEQQKGNMLVSPPASPADELSEPSRPRGRLLAACAGLTLAACSAVQVREVDREWLEDCSAKAHDTVSELGLRNGEPYLVDLLNETGRRKETPFFLKPGPVEANWDGRWPGTEPSPEVQQRLKGAKLFGKTKVLGNRMSVHLDRLRTADGREFPICAVGYSVWLTEPGVERWGPGSHAGVDVGNDDPRLLAALADLRPGEFPVPGSDIWISFGTFFRAELFSRNAPRR
jgi:hypothetical protein